MAIQRYRPLSLMDQLNREMSSLFDSSALAANFDTEEWSPAVDIRENVDNFVIHADLPGVNSDDIEVIAENGVITIKGERESKKEKEKDHYKRIERFSGRFLRRFTLPDTADLNKISAKSKNGVLELTITKEEKVQPKRIEVQWDN